MDDSVQGAKVSDTARAANFNGDSEKDFTMCRRSGPVTGLLSAIVLSVAVGGQAHAQGFQSYDSFPGPLINQELWQGSSVEGNFSQPTTDFVRMIDNGRLRLGLVSYGNTNSDSGTISSRQGLSMRDLGTKGGSRFIVGVKAKVTVVDADVQDCPANPATGTSGSRARAQLIGTVFNDGSGAGNGDATGDIAVQLQLQKEVDGSNRISATLLRCIPPSPPNPSCSTAEIVSMAGNPVVFASGWTLNTPAVLKIIWQPDNDRVKFVATSAGNQEVQFINYGGTLTDTDPVQGFDFKQVRVNNTVENCNGARQHALMEALFDNIAVKRQP